MRIIVFGGTKEGRELAVILKNKHSVTVSVAGETGERMLSGISGIDIEVGRKDKDQLKRLISDFDICVDATHPYAEEVSLNIRNACKELNIDDCRLLRDSGLKAGEEVITVPDAGEAALSCSGFSGNILLTTGAKEIGSFDRIERDRLYVRVLPVTESIEACKAAGIPERNIIAMFGPFSKELNLAIMRQYDIRLLVTKDGGKEGGIREKLEAAKECGAGTILIKRPEEEGYSMEEILDIIEKKGG